MGLQITRITKEVTYGVTPSSPATGTQIDVFLPTANANTVLPRPSFWNIRDAAQGNRKVREDVGWTGISGDLQTYLFPSQAALFMGLAGTLIGSAPCQDLGSFTVDRLITLEDGACGKIYARYVGCKFANFNISCDSSDQGCLTMIKGSIVGSRRVTISGSDFPVPVLSSYPSDDPYEFFHTSTHLTIGGVRSNYGSFSIGIANQVKALRDESRFAQIVRYFGRDVTFGAKLLYKAAADRDAYENGTKQAVSVEWDNGTNNLTVDLGGQCNIDNLDDDLPLDDYFWQNMSLSALVDPATGTDLTITAGTDA